MSKFGKRKDGRYYKKTPRQRPVFSSDDFPDPKKPSKKITYFSPDDFRRRKPDPTPIKKEPTKEERKEERFKRVQTLSLGTARCFLIRATPLIVQLDPTLASVYTSYKIGKYGYGIYQKVKKEYDVYGDYNKALENVVHKEVEEKITSKLKSLPIKNASEFASKGIWNYYKEQNPENNISPRLEKIAISAMTKTFEEIGEKAL